jgi:virulence-associated protein VagC
MGQARQSQALVLPAQSEGPRVEVEIAGHNQTVVVEPVKESGETGGLPGLR